ncbi:MAG: protein-glutamate O-methyltransferase CheR [Gemmatimonadota bacterium]
MSAEDEASFAALATVISAGTGMTLGAYKEKCLRRRIAVRMRACGVHTFEEYRRVLSKTPAEMASLFDVLTINVTKFFRNREAWARVSETAISDLFERLHGRVRVWSAGCSSGEEPYTIAILLAEAGLRSNPQWRDRYAIDATDIDRMSLERCAAAFYQTPSLAETPPELISKYFVSDGADGWSVTPELRARVRVTRNDLTREAAPGAPYDLITCRNVVIYFDRPTQEALLERFHDALRPGGYLLLGKVETIFGPSRNRLELVDARERIYRRPVE